MSAALALALTPHGRVVIDTGATPGEAAPGPAAGSLASAALCLFAVTLPVDEAFALLDLAARFPSTAFSPSVTFFRDVAAEILSAAAGQRPPRQTVFADLLASAPPMLGSEYLSDVTLEGLRDRLGDALDREVAGETLEGWLRERNPVWNVLGRVCFHLAENRTNPDRPFAFLATFSAGLSGNRVVVAGDAAVQHRPLGQALAESAAIGDKAGLLRLLVPVQRAAEAAAWVKELMDSQAIFRPQAWTAMQAHRLLRDVPVLEAAGLVVRVPDWWRSTNKPRVRVAVSLGANGASALGTSSLLSFDVGLAMDGEPLTAAEWEALKVSGAGLVPLRGRWVEVDRERLDQVLAIWAHARAEAKAGVPFHKAMRLLAGAGRPSRLGTVEVEGDEWSRVTAGPWLAEVLARIRAPGNEAASLPGTALKATLRPYQEHGVRWLGFLNQLGLGACLADDMGLGKTIQVLSLLLVLKARAADHGQGRLPHLLVAPASLLGNWRAEAARFAPSLVLRIAHSSGDGMNPDSVAGADLIATTYGTLATTEWLRKLSWDTVILDEAQAIKNPGTRQTKCVTSLDARVRVALTGTPVENRAGDLWSLFHFLQPGLLGTAADFRRFANDRAGAPGRWAPLRALVSPYLLRRLKTDPLVAPDLPAKTEMSTECGLTREQATLYQRAVDDLARALEQDKQERAAGGIARRGLILAALLRFKQICNHPSHWLGDSGWEIARSGKLLRLVELIEPIAQRQEKLLLFSQFREVVEPLANVLAGLFGRAGLVLHGGTAIKDRQPLVNRFQADDAIPFVVLSLRAGGTGLNLTAATHVVHFDRWWNPAVEEQATDRAFRIGQKRPVFVHKFVSRGTVEERVDQMLSQKRGLARELLSGEDEVRLTELSDEELLRTVSLDLKRATLD